MPDQTPACGCTDTWACAACDLQAQIEEAEYVQSFD